MGDWQRKGRKPLGAAGVDVNTPVDLQRSAGTFPFMQNVIAFTDGTCEVRPALSDRYASYVPTANKTPWHSAKRLNDSSSGSKLWTLIHGVGDSLVVERSSAVGTLVLVESGYDGNPLTMVVFNPLRTPQPWMYVANANKMRKINVSNATTHSVGIPPPFVEPFAIPLTKTYKIIDDFENITGPPAWVPANGTLSADPQGFRINTTVTRFVAIPGLVNNNYLIQPASMANIGVGTSLSIGGTAYIVAEVHRGGAATTISSIAYDTENGRAGAPTKTATVVLTIANREIDVGSLIYNTTRNEQTRIDAVIPGPNGVSCFRIATNNTTWAATDVVQIVPSFTVIGTGGGIANTNAIQSKFVAATSTGPYPNTSAPLQITKTIALDLSQTTDAFGNVIPFTLDDFMHIGLKIDVPLNIAEIHVLLDVDSATNNFTQNYYEYAISQSDLQAFIKNQQTALDNRQTQIRNRIVDRARPIDIRSGPTDSSSFGVEPPSPDDPSTSVDTPDPSTDPSRQQLAPGDNQYTEIVFPMSAMQRVGTDGSRSMKDVQALRLEVICSAAVVVSIDSWNIFGGYPLDTTDPAEIGYQYAVRYRVSSTGAVSDLSPLSRGPIETARQSVYVIFGGTAPLAEIDKLDWFRIGGSLTIPCYIGSSPIGLPSFIDTIGDNAALAAADANGTFQFDLPDLQPFPTQQLPASGTCNVAGTVVTRTGGTAIDSSWLPGVAVVINGKAVQLYRVVNAGAGIFEISMNLGTLSGVTFEIPQPVKIGQPLPIMWGTFNDHGFACGDPLNPGVLYVTKPKNLDSAPQRYRLQITSGSEVLQNGFVYGNSAGVFSDKRLFYLDYDPTNQFGSVFSARESPYTKGLYAKYAIAVGRRGVAWLSDDGMYMFTTESGIRNLTVGQLRQLFPYAGRPGSDVVTATGTISAPNMPNPVGAEEPYLRLCFAEDDDALYFFYRSSGGVQKCLRYGFTIEGFTPFERQIKEGWYPFAYQKPIVFAYSEEGPGVRNTIMGGADATTAHLYNLGGAGDNGTDAGAAIPCIVQTYADDFDDPRSDKQFGDIDVDIDPGGATITVLPYFDNFSVVGIGKVIGPSSGRISPPTIVDLQSGATDQFGRNVGLGITWSNGSGQRPRLYLWEPSFIPHPELTFLRSTDLEFVADGLLYVRGVWIRGNTLGVNRTVLVEYIDHAGALQTFTLPNINQSIKSAVYYPIATPFYASTIRFRPTDANKWRFYGAVPDGDKAPPFSTEPSAFTDDGEIGNKLLQGGIVDIDTHNTIVTLQVQGDAGAVLGNPTPFQCAQRSQIPFDLNPAMPTHLMRIVPQQAAHIFGVKWLWQSEADLADYFETQDMALDLDGFKHAYEFWLAYKSAANPITLTLKADGVAIANIPTFPASTNYTVQRVLIPATKAKSFKGVLTSTSKFYCYKRDCAFKVKRYGSTGDYVTIQPFGFVHRDRGVAPI